MPVTTARVATTRASRYLQQLCKHWSHKFTVTFTEQAGTVALPAGLLTLAAQDDALLLEIRGDDAAALERMQTVVAEHVDRFAHKEAPLVYDWAAG